MFIVMKQMLILDKPGPEKRLFKVIKKIFPSVPPLEGLLLILRFWLQSGLSVASENNHKKMNKMCFIAVTVARKQLYVIYCGLCFMFVF